MPARNRKTRSDCRFEEQLLQKLRSEKSGLVTRGAIDRMEKDITDEGMGEARRLALHFLSKPWSERENAIRSNRDTAVTFAAGAAYISDVLPRYKRLVRLLEIAEMRTCIALWLRGDHKDVEAEGRRILYEPVEERQEAGHA